VKIVFDTSAFIKLLVEEPGSAECREIYTAASQIAASRLLLAETESALQRRFREGGLTSPQLLETQKSAHRLIASFYLLSVDAVLPLSQRLLQTSGPLRTLDAIHIATAQTLAAPLVAFDRQLKAAAERCGQAVLPN
jgi:predicted nucleic acid-binding protein